MSGKTLESLWAYTGRRQCPITWGDILWDEANTETEVSKVSNVQRSLTQRWNYGSRLGFLA